MPKTNGKVEFKPIFVVGNSRSGTTLMGTILGRHAIVFRFEELHFFEELWSATDSGDSCSRMAAAVLIAKLFDIQRNGYLTRGDWRDFLKEAESVVEAIATPIPIAQVFKSFLEYEAQLQGKQIPCEQTPQNILYLSEILEQYPHARIIHMIRDPRAILLSQKNRWRRPFLAENIPKREAIRYWINYHPITISQLWKANVRATNQFLEDERVYTLRYEDLLTQAETEVKKICQFIGIDYSSELLEVPQVNSSSQKDAPQQRGINKDRADSWKQGGLSQVELYWCQRINQSLMATHGYQAQAVSANPILLLLSSGLFPIKLSLAILLSLKRMKNLGEAIKRRLR